MLFNTAYDVAKHNRPFSDYAFLCDVQRKNGVQSGNVPLAEMPVPVSLNPFLMFC